MRDSLPVRQQICITCNKTYSTSRRDLSCYQCSNRRLNKTCSECGVIISDRAVKCKSCHRIYFSSTSTGKSRDLSPTWRGGVTRTSKGYVYERCENHPRATNKYVLQHILVMEDKLGRYLYKGENVHHKNGVKDDNRPENLELWVTNQPSGQRPEDLVEWAQEILRRYVSEI